MAANRSHHSLATSDNASTAAHNNNNHPDGNSRQPSPCSSPSLSPSSIPLPASRPSSIFSPTLSHRPSSAVLSPTLAPSSPLLSPCSSLLPQPTRSLNPHTLLPTNQEGIFPQSELNCSQQVSNESGNPKAPSWRTPTPSAPHPLALPAHSSYSPSQYVDEKAALRLYEENTASQRHQHHRVSVAPSTSSFVEAAPLYDAAFTQHPDNPFNRPTSIHRHTQSYDLSQGARPLHPSERPSCPSPLSSTSRPDPSDLEMYRHDHYAPYCTLPNADISTRSRAVPKSKSRTAADRTERQRSSDKRRKKISGNARQTRLSDTSTLEGTCDGDFRIPSSTNLSGSTANRSSPSTVPISAHPHLIGRHSNLHSRSEATSAGTLQQPVVAPPPVSRNRFSLFRRTSVSQEAHLKNRRSDDNNHHHVSWKNGSIYPFTHRERSTHEDRGRYSRSKKLWEKVPYWSGGSQYRKSGYPGRNGEEPETNLFNFIDVMINMPDTPSLKAIVTKMLKTLLLMTIMYFALMAMYFAAEFQSVDRLHNINVLVVDLDKSMIASNFINFTQQDNRLPGQVNWSIQSGYKDVQSVINDVDNGNYWGAIVIMPNASTALNRAVSAPDPDYDPSKAFMFIYDSGRNPLVVKPYIVANMYTQFLQFTTNFNPTWISFVLTFADGANTTLTPLVKAPQALGMPVAFTELDLHPPTATIISSATSVAYIWIFLVAGGSTYFVANIVQPIARNASVRKAMLLLIVPLVTFLSSLSMAYTVLLGIFGVPFESARQFFALFFGMLLVQSAVASLVLFLIFMVPVIYIPPITVTFVVMNVIAVFNPVELMPAFYRWVYAMPFLNGVQISRYILMGSYSRLSYNLPILFAWVLIPITFLPFAIARQRRLLMDAMATKSHNHPYRHTAPDHYPDSDGHRFQEEQDYGQDAWEDVRRDYKARRRGRSNYGAQGSCSIRGRRRNEYTDRNFNLSHRSEGDDSRDSYDDATESELSSLDEGGGEGGRAREDYHANSKNITRTIGSLNPRPLGNGPSPSAPPESQIFDTSYQAARHIVDQDRSIIEMPKLSRHPYASELVRPTTPDEVKE